MQLLRSHSWFRWAYGLGIGLLSLLLCVSFAVRSVAIDIPDISNPRQTDGGWVTDMAGILSPATEDQLNAEISQFEAETTAEIVLLF